MKKLIYIIFGMILLTSCMEKTSYKLEDIEYLGMFHNDLFLPSQEHHRYCIIISKDKFQKELIISTKHKLHNIQAGDSIYLRNDDLIKIVK